MIGLTWGDAALTLTPLQWGAVIGNCAAWLAQWRYQLDRRIVALLTCAMLFGAFWNVPIGRDTILLFEQSGKLSVLGWTDFIDTFYKRAYLEFQTPFYPFVVSRFPVFWQHQLSLLPYSLMTILVLFEVFGPRAALLCATPLIGLMLHQPSTDFLLFIGMAFVLRLIQIGQRGIAALVYGLCWLIKPLVILTLPWMLLELRGAGLLSLAMWANYIIISLAYPFGRHQAIFLTRQLLLMPHVSAPRLGWQARTLQWRWLTIGRQALQALPFYLFPAWLTRWSWAGVVMLGCILGGYGNIKYQILTLLHVFPITTDQEML